MALKAVCPFYEFHFNTELGYLVKNPQFPDADDLSAWTLWFRRWERLIRLPLTTFQLATVVERFVSLTDNIRKNTRMLDAKVSNLLKDTGLQIERHAKAIAQQIISNNDKIPSHINEEIELRGLHNVANILKRIS